MTVFCYEWKGRKGGSEKAKLPKYSLYCNSFTNIVCTVKQVISSPWTVSANFRTSFESLIQVCFKFDLKVWKFQGVLKVWKFQGVIFAFQIGIRKLHLENWQLFKLRQTIQFCTHFFSQQPVWTVFQETFVPANRKTF